jgi:hypothetical protein
VTERSGEPGSDPVGEFQRWLMRAGARGLSREVADKVRNTIQPGRNRGDVWETAVSEPVGESPECQWCPICRAARQFRDSGPNLGSRVAGVSDTLVGFAAEAASMFDAALKAGSAGPRPATARPGASRPDNGRSDDGTVVGTRVPGPVAHPQHQHDEPGDEGTYRAEGGEAGDRPAGDQGDDQVERTAE